MRSSARMHERRCSCAHSFPDAFKALPEKGGSVRPCLDAGWLVVSRGLLEQASTVKIVPDALQLVVLQPRGHLSSGSRVSSLCVHRRRPQHGCVR